MPAVYIKFPDRAAEAHGVEQLALHTRVNGYPGGIYRVLEEDLKWLDETGFPYEMAREDDVVTTGRLRKHA